MSDLGTATAEAVIDNGAPVKMTPEPITDRCFIRGTLWTLGAAQGIEVKETKRSIYYGDHKRFVFDNKGRIEKIYDYEHHIVATASSTKPLYK